MTDTIRLENNGRQLRDALTSLLSRQPSAKVDDVMKTILAVASKEQDVEQAAEPAWPSSVRDLHVTQREREVIAHIGNGMSNNEIAKEMNVATHTVKAHVRNIMMKLGVRSRLQIAARIYRERWIPAMSA
jgi:two-component system nitrate/nitrite response regulator NarL